MDQPYGLSPLSAGGGIRAINIKPFQAVSAPGVLSTLYDLVMPAGSLAFDGDAAVCEFWGSLNGLVSTELDLLLEGSAILSDPAVTGVSGYLIRAKIVRIGPSSQLFTTEYILDGSPIAVSVGAGTESLGSELHLTLKSNSADGSATCDLALVDFRSHLP